MKLRESLLSRRQLITGFITGGLASLAAFVLYPVAGFPMQPAPKHSERHTVPKVGFSDVEKWAKVFEDPKRAAWQKPEEVIEKLALKSPLHLSLRRLLSVFLRTQRPVQAERWLSATSRL